MTNIDISKIQPGDTVQVRIHTPTMKEAGVEPAAVRTRAYKGPDGSGQCAAGFSLFSDSLRVLEYTSSWYDALVVRDCNGELWGKVTGETWRKLGDGYYVLSSRDLDTQQGPITAVEIV